MRYTYRLFNSASAVMLVARRLEKTGMRCKVVPIPREFSSECGVCLRTITEEEYSVETVLRDLKSTISKIYRRDIL